ncbi:nucleolus and neural progenitor protein [Pelodytes ibericus]
MISEPWNRVHIPRPAIQSSLTLPLGAGTEQHIKKVVERCLDVLSSLRSHILKTEIAALHSLLYVFHHRLSLHKPYLAIKQVDQCIKRIDSMGLDGSIQEMLDLCPKYIGRNESQMKQYCSVPSQPIVELVSVKILGACKLLLRLMDCCCKAFHLCAQHLYLEEFMVLNLTLLGLLSRFWVMYRGILKKLMSLYDAQFALQQEVSSFQNMPYIKDFTFPAKMEDFLGAVFIDIASKKLPTISYKKQQAKFLNKMFRSSELNVNARELKKPVTVDRSEKRQELIDMGRPIKNLTFNRGKLGTFDVKALCKPLKSNTLLESNLKQISSASDKTKTVFSHSRLKVKCVKHLVPKILKVECFRDLSEQLKHAVTWCKQRRMAAETMFFRNNYLKSNRWKHVEAQGYCLKNKLQHLKKSICHHLHKGTLRAHHRRPCLKAQTFRRTWSHKVIRKPEDSVKHHIMYSLPTVGVTSKIGSDQGICDKELLRTVTAIDLTPGALETRSGDPDVEATTDKDDIDDIFSSIDL